MSSWTKSCTIFLVALATLAFAGCSGGGSNTPPPTNSYTISGTLSGLSTGESVSLQDNGADKLAISANGSFSFPMSLNSGTSYAITVNSHTPGIACSVTGGSGTVGSSSGTIDVSCAAGTETVLYSFGATSTDGNSPYADLIMDSAGDLYGTTMIGGANGEGTVFKISSAGTETVLHSFGATSTDGKEPEGGLIMDSAGNLYGTTAGGGANYGGTVFKISAAGTETVLYSFGATSTDGQNPIAGLIMDSAGNLYGTTWSGGAHFDGTVFKISATGTETVLHSFAGGATDGRLSEGGLIMDSAGDLYGTTLQGGANSVGTVFKISAAGTETVLYSFGATSTDGEYPAAGLIMDSAGNLYGTTKNGGAYGGAGTVFKISASGTETVLYSFGATSTDGTYPHAGLIMDSTGNLYGTTQQIGASSSGTVFKISTAGTETLLYSFGATSTDGAFPQAGLILDSAGDLYGTTSEGGANGGFGTVFKIN
jgi:uncharacterized repeat protein (TIGR03803 family)